MKFLKSFILISYLLFPILSFGSALYKSFYIPTRLHCEDFNISDKLKLFNWKCESSVPWEGIYEALSVEFISVPERYITDHKGLVVSIDSFKKGVGTLHLLTDNLMQWKENGLILKGKGMLSKMEIRSVSSTWWGDDFLKEKIFHRTLSSSLNLSKSRTLDEYYNAFSSCVGLSEDFLKALAFIESSGEPDKSRRRSQYKGLFQVGHGFCEEAKKDLGMLDCQERDKVMVNFSATVIHLRDIIQRIRNNCPQEINDQDLIKLIYVGHNNGHGAFSALMSNKACTGKKIEHVLKRYYPKSKIEWGLKKVNYSLKAYYRMKHYDKKATVFEQVGVGATRVCPALMYRRDILQETIL
jgi:hypothetical protein